MDPYWYLKKKKKKKGNQLYAIQHWIIFRNHTIHNSKQQIHIIKLDTINVFSVGSMGDEGELATHS